MNRDILKLALPAIAGNITVPLLGMADMALMGHLPSEEYIGAIALGSMLFNFIYWAFGFLRMGTSGLTAQAYGKKDWQETSYSLYRALLLAVVTGLTLILMKWPLAELAFYLIKGSETVEALARNYFMIRVYAAPAALSLFALTGWFIGMQNSRIPVMVLIAINIMNIGLNFLFVYGLDMTSNGIAFGTLIAQYTGLALAILFLITKFKKFLTPVQKEILAEMQAVKRFFSINKNIFIRTFCIIAVHTFFTSHSAAINDNILAVNSLLLQYLMLFSFVADGFAYAGEALTGKFFGSRDKAKLNLAIKKLFQWGFGLAGLFTLAYMLGGETILNLLTSNEELKPLAREYMPWVWLIPITGVAAFTWDGIYIGATAGPAMRDSLLLAAFAVFFPVFFLGRAALGNHALWLAMLLFMLARGIIQTAWRKKAIYSFRGMH